MKPGTKPWMWAAALSLWLVSVIACSPRVRGASSAETEGASLAAELRERRPAEVIRLTGQIEIRDGEGKRKVLPVQFETKPTEEGWTATYLTGAAGGGFGEKLIVVHRVGKPNLYRWGSGEGITKPETLGPKEAVKPFAGSDFSLADLGLDFLHWPVQKIVRTKHTMRKGRACFVLESARAPADAGAGYHRVVSWIDQEGGGPIYAEAYDQKNALVKTFEVDRVGKIDGVTQVKEMKIRTEASDSKTIIRFDSGAE